MTAGRRMAIIASSVMLLAVVAGLWINGSPGEHRERRLDLRRVEDLRTLDAAVRAFRDREGRLPDSLGAFTGQVPENTRDPVDGEPYEYRRLEGRRYELCARFTHPGPGRRGGLWQGNQAPWRHAAGRQCFPRELLELRAGAE